MKSRDSWQERLDDVADATGAHEGYHLVYGPWANISSARTAFVSANPGRRPADGLERMVYDERGNSFEVEATTTLSPITQQFLKLCAFLELAPSELLVGCANPFRTQSEADLSPAQRRMGTALAYDFWSECISYGRIWRIVTSSNSARSLIVRVTNAKPIAELASGWGPVAIKCYEFGDSGRIVALPQLSRYKLFSRAACERPLREAFEL